MARVYRELHSRLRRMPGTEKLPEYELFPRYLSAADATAGQFETAAGYRARNRIELRSGLTHPTRMAVFLTRFANALNAAAGAPWPLE
jgi:hypothetical protein